MKYAVVNKPKKRNHVPFKDQVGEIIKSYKDYNDENKNIYTLKFGDIEEYFFEDEIKILKEKEKIDTTLKYLKNFKHIKRENYPNDVPMIPQGYDDDSLYSLYNPNKKKINNNSVYFSWEDSIFASHPVCGYFDNRDYLQILKYINGDFFRTKKDAIINKNKMIDSIYKNFDKMKDWAGIERAIFNDETLNRGSLENIKLSKFSNHKKFKHYYKICCNREFNTFTIEKQNIVPSAIMCFDYAVGNFFITKSEAENSVMYKKMKTFFKEQKNHRI